jgi:hypothetical protein
MQFMFAKMERAGIKLFPETPWREFIHYSNLRETLTTKIAVFLGCNIYTGVSE